MRPSTEAKPPGPMIRDGDEDRSGAVEELLRRGYRFALSLSHDAAGAEDILQDAWVSVLRAKGPWTREYLFTAIRSRFVDGRRRERAAPIRPLSEVFEPDAEPGAAFWSDCSVPPILNDELEVALARLRPEERAAMVLSAVEGYTAREIADVLGLPRGTVLSLMHRARGKLRRWLRDIERQL